MAVELHHDDETLRVLVRDHLCVARWLDTPTARHFGVITAAMRAASVGGERAGLLNVIDAPGKMPRFTDELRHAGAAMSRAIDPLTAATAHVVLLDGLVGTSVRMFLSTLALLSRVPGVVSTCGQVDEGARWLAAHPRVARRWTATGILSAYQLVA